MTQPTFSVRFFVPGIPRPGGSKRAFYNKKLGRSMIVETGKHTKAWREDVRAAAAKAMANKPLMEGALRLVIVFVMPRPKSHYRTGKNAHLLRDDAPRYHTSAPDSTKLTRSTEDAMTMIVWKDDSRVADQHVKKVYKMPAQACGAWVEVSTLWNELEEPDYE